jgi:hypothetical protein
MTLHVFGAHEYGRLALFLDLVLREPLLHALTYKVLGLRGKSVKNFPDK